MTTLLERNVQPTCFDVFEWPEMKALCSRLGIDANKSTSFLRITLTDPNNPVMVEHSYQAEDTKPKIMEPLVWPPTSEGSFSVDAGTATS